MKKLYTAILSISLLTLASQVIASDNQHPARFLGGAPGGPKFECKEEAELVVYAEALQPPYHDAMRNHAAPAYAGPSHAYAGAAAAGEHAEAGREHLPAANAEVAERPTSFIHMGSPLSADNIFVLMPQINAYSITSIDLSNRGIDDNGLFALGYGLSMDNELISLNLSGNKFSGSSNGLKLLSEKLRFIRIEKLDFSNNEIDDKGVKDLLFYGLNPTLRELHLEGNRFTFEGALDLANSISSCKNLTIYLDKADIHGQKPVYLTDDVIGIFRKNGFTNLEGDAEIDGKWWYKG